MSRAPVEGLETEQFLNLDILYCELYSLYLRKTSIELFEFFSKIQFLENERGS